MTMQKVDELRKDIEKISGRTVRLRSTNAGNKLCVFIDINAYLYRCVSIGELYWTLSDIYWLICCLKHGKNRVEF